MFEEIVRRLQGLEAPLDGAALVSLIEARDLLDAQICRLAGALDHDGSWAQDGASSMTGWLKAHARMGGRAGGLTRTAHRLSSSPVTAAAWRDGSLSSGQVEVVVAHVAPRHLELWTEHEAGVVPSLVGLSVRDTELAMSHWARHADSLVGQPPAGHDERHLSVNRTFAGRYEISGQLDSETGGLLETALRVADTGHLDPEDQRRSPRRRRADALGDISKFFLDHQHLRPAGSHRPHVNVIVTHEELAAGVGARTDSGAPLDRVALQAVLCDCHLHRVLIDQRGAVLDYGRSTRTITPDVRAALVVRDRGCRFPGCDRPASWADGHHVTWWRHGGRTRLDNLVLLCRRHHRVVHRPGWHAQLRDGATFEVTDPNGHTRTTRPPGHTERLVA